MAGRYLQPHLLARLVLFTATCHVRLGTLRGTACYSVLYPLWSYKVPQSTFDVKPKYPVTSNHDHFAPIRRTFSGVFACVATGDQPARAGPRDNRLPQQAQRRPPTAPYSNNLHMSSHIRNTFAKAIGLFSHGSTRRKRHKADDAQLPRTVSNSCLRSR